MKNVLLMGNGMNRAYRSEAFSWQKLLEDMTTVESLPEMIKWIKHWFNSAVRCMGLLKVIRCAVFWQSY